MTATSTWTKQVSAPSAAARRRPTSQRVPALLATTTLIGIIAPRTELGLRADKVLARDGALASASAERPFTNSIFLATSFDGDFSDHSSSCAGKGSIRYVW